jgi:hypothetical protein
VLVERADLKKALSIVSGEMGKRVSGATIRFEDGWLWVVAGNAAGKAPGRGFLQNSVVVASSWVRRLARSLPPGNPVFVHVENGRLYANKYSEPCQWTSTHFPLFPSLRGVDENRRILEAATVLKDFLITPEQLKWLVAFKKLDGPPPWREDEQTMISAVAEAWSHLAPLGVGTSDLRALIDNSVRDAFKRRTET